MGFIALIYIVLSLALLLYCYRAIIASCLCTGLAVVANGVIQSLLFVPILPGELSRSFIRGAVEEALRSSLLSRLGNATNVKLSVATGVIFAGGENTGTLYAFLGPHLTANTNLVSLIDFYHLAESNLLLLFSVSIQPFLRLGLHILFVFSALTALSARRFGVWGGVVLLHGALNVSITYLVSIDEIPLAVLAIAVFAGSLLLIMNSQRHLGAETEGDDMDCDSLVQ